MGVGDRARVGIGWRGWELGVGGGDRGCMEVEGLGVRGGVEA